MLIVEALMLNKSNHEPENEIKEKKTMKLVVHIIMHLYRVQNRMTDNLTYNTISDPTHRYNNEKIAVLKHTHTLLNLRMEQILYLYTIVFELLLQS